VRSGHAIVHFVGDDATEADDVFPASLASFPHQDRRSIENDTRHEQLMQQLVAEREEVQTQLNKRIDELYDEIAHVQRDRDERLILAEADKQQVPHAIHIH
jgi:hypothetical protein